MATAPTRIFSSYLQARNLRTRLRTAITTLTISTNKLKNLYGGGTTVISLAAGFTVTLPVSNGTGQKYRFVAGTTLTSGTYVIKVANSTDVFAGGVLLNDIGDTTAATADFFPTAASSDTYTMTASIGGGKRGDWVEFEDIATGFWAVNGVQQGITDPVTPFSATV